MSTAEQPNTSELKPEYSAKVELYFVDSLRKHSLRQVAGNVITFRDEVTFYAPVIGSLEVWIDGRLASRKLVRANIASGRRVTVEDVYHSPDVVKPPSPTEYEVMGGSATWFEKAAYLTLVAAVLFSFLAAMFAKIIS